MASKNLRPITNWRRKVHEVIYEADTPLGKGFDIALLIFIILSVIAVMLESVDSINARYSKQLHILEWFFTIVFTLEYFGRIISITRPSKYIFSFYGTIDFFSTIPSYLVLLFGGGHFFLTLRALRLLRVFRILKLVRYLKEARTLQNAFKQSRAKITVFLFAVLMITIIMGTLMYIIESDEAGFTSIPESIYWAIVTLTTVGYGDIAPITPFGQAIASLIMIIGYAIIAVPTGIVTSEMLRSNKEPISTNTQACMHCSKEGHEDDAFFCKYCGEAL